MATVSRHRYLQSNLDENLTQIYSHFKKSKEMIKHKYPNQKILDLEFEAKNALTEKPFKMKPYVHHSE